MIVIDNKQKLKEKIHPEMYDFFLEVIDKFIQDCIIAGEREIDKVYNKKCIVERAEDMIGAEIEFSYKVITEKDKQAFFENDIIRIRLAENPNDIEIMKNESKKYYNSRKEFRNINLN